MTIVRRTLTGLACLATAATVTVAGAGTASAATSRSISGSSPDGGATFSGKLTWVNSEKFTATVTLRDAKCDSHSVYFYFVINKGWTSEWHGKRRDNTDGCNRSITWSGISGSDREGIWGPTLRVCTNLQLRPDSCRDYDYDNPYFPEV